MKYTIETFLPELKGWHGLLIGDKLGVKELNFVSNMEINK